MSTPTRITVILAVHERTPELASNLVEIADHFSIYASYDFTYIILEPPGWRMHDPISSFARHRTNVKVLGNQRQRNFVRMLRSAFSAARGEFVIVLNSDLTYHPSVGMELIELLERENADVALASSAQSGAYRTACVKQLPKREETALARLWSSLRLVFAKRLTFCFACRLT